MHSISRGLNHHSIVTNALVVAEAALLGSFATLLFIRAALVQIMYRLVSAEGQAEILNVLDHMLPYFAIVGALALVLTVLTSIALGFKSRSLRVAALPAAGLLATGLVFFIL